MNTISNIKYYLVVVAKADMAPMSHFPSISVVHERIAFMIVGSPSPLCCL